MQRKLMKGIMKTENQNVATKIKRYLEKLGYPSYSISFEYGSSDFKVDVVIRDKNEILVVAEIINLETKGLSSLIKEEEVSYHPLTRTLQSEAVRLKAKYYLLTDGEEFLWLKTGLTGRPEKIHEVSYNNFHFTESLTSSEFLINFLWQFPEYVRSFPITNDPLFDISIILYYQLIKERGNNQETYDVDYIFKDIDYLLRDNNNKKNLAEALYRFNLIDIKLIDHPKVVLSFIDNLFKSGSKELVVPRWLADFMIKLLELPFNAKLIDVFGRNGVISASAGLNKHKDIKSYYYTQQEFFWLNIQRLLLDSSDKDNITYSSISELLTQNLSSKGILIAPPFNVKLKDIGVINLDSNLPISDIKDLSALLMLKGIIEVDEDGCIIVIIPDGFLFSGDHGSVKARKYLQSYVEAIISLPVNTFTPYSALKTSLLILSRKKRNNSKDILFANLKVIPNNNILSEAFNKEVLPILSAISDFRKDSNIHLTKDIAVIKDMEPTSWHISRYLKNEIKTDLPLMPLKEIASIFRGNSLVKDNEGTIRYLAPAAIRELVIDTDQIEYTSEKKLPNGNLFYTAENDIVINAIGNYKGKAALIDSSLKKLLINRHVILLRPKSDIIHPGYLTVTLNTDFIQTQFYNKIAGSVIPALNLSSFEDILVPIPSLEEQIAIYSQYEKKLALLSSLKRDQKKIEEELTSMLISFEQKKGGEI